MPEVGYDRSDTSTILSIRPGWLSQSVLDLTDDGSSVRWGNACSMHIRFIIVSWFKTLARQHGRIHPHQNTCDEHNESRHDFLCVHFAFY